MWRYGVGLFAVLWALCFPANCTAQGLPFTDTLYGFSVGTVEIEPSVKVGYQHIALNMNLPVPFSGLLGPALATASGLDFGLRDAGVWIGGVGVDARLGAFSLFVNGEANAGKSVRVSTPSEPFFGGDGPVEWRGSRLQWWSLGGGGSLDISSNAAVVGGFKAEQLSLRLADPVDPTGEIQRWHVQYGDQYSGDLSTKLWAPYFGLRLRGPNSKATLIFSPYTWADVSIPFRYLYVYDPGITYFYEDAQYTFKRGGILLEGDFDYRIQASANAGCTLWLKGAWCQIRGRGAEDYQLDVTDLGIPVFSFSTSASADGSFTSYVLAGGLSFLYAF